MTESLLRLTADGVAITPGLPVWHVDVKTGEVSALAAGHLLAEPSTGRVVIQAGARCYWPDELCASEAEALRRGRQYLEYCLQHNHEERIALEAALGTLITRQMALSGGYPE